MRRAVARWSRALYHQKSPHRPWGFFVCAMSLYVLAMTGFGCQPSLSWSSVEEMIQKDFPEVTQLKGEALARQMESDESRPLLLDVREAEEFAVSHLPGAIHVDPNASTDELLEILDRDRRIVAYCSVGYRSSRLAQQLMNEGFENVSNLEGSIFRWANEGRPLVRDGEPVREAHPYDEHWGQLLEPQLRAYLPPK